MLSSARASEVGSLEVGKKADLILIDLVQTHLVPLHGFYDDVVANIVYNACGGDVHTVIIDGKFVVEDHKCVTVDKEKVMAVAQETAEDLWARSQF
jgi:5-methylthioadenosine/S-adenosylhomocysteine deaminase